MRIGPYEVLGELGRGGMGVVYRVRAPDGIDAALKVIVRADAATFARFERERRLLASLGEEEGFVGLLDAGVSEAASESRCPWLLMPFVPGGTLREKLAAGPLAVEETVSLGLEVARALAAAHARGIVHRDVKPANILFTAKGRPLLADLGLAKHFDRTAPGASQSLSLTRDGAFKGTAGYMAPEQLHDASAVGPAADVFALGAVLHECLAGRPAFSGESALEVLTKVESATLEPIGRPDVPAWLVAVIDEALAHDPRERPADGAALARALERRAPRVARGRTVRVLLLAAAGGAGLLAALFLGRRVPAPVAPAVPARRPGPPAPAALPALTAGALVDRAQEDLARGDLAGAIEACNRAIELDPRCAPAWVKRAYARGELGARNDAAADYGKAIELDPGIAQAWAGRGLERYEMSDRDGARADFERAIELDPTLAIAWANRGLVRGEQGDREGELADLTRAIEIEPTLSNVWVNRGNVKREMGDAAGAIADETRAIELDPGILNSWIARGAARYMAGDLDGAIADETRAIELDPARATAWENRAFARGAKGDLSGCIADCTKTIELAPGDAGAWGARGQARLASGDRDGIADLERALELEPAGPNAAKIRAVLEEAKRGR